MTRSELLHQSSIVRLTIRLILSILGIAWLTIDAGEALAKSRKPTESTLINLNVIRGVIRPSVEAVISGEIQARIIGMPFTEGQRFRKGQILVAFDCSKPKAELNVAQAEYEARQKILENNLEMAKLNAIADLEVALSSADLRKARAAISIARVIVDRCRIWAPFSGRVVKTFVNPHESINPYDELMSIIDESRFEIELILPSNSLLWVKRGTPFSFTIDETGKSHRAKVTEIGASINPASQTLRVRGVFTAQPKLVLSGMSGSANFPNQPEEEKAKGFEKSIPQKPNNTKTKKRATPAKMIFDAKRVMPQSIRQSPGSEQSMSKVQRYSSPEKMSNLKTTKSQKQTTSHIKGKTVLPKGTMQPSIWEKLLEKIQKISARIRDE